MWLGLSLRRFRWRFGSCCKRPSRTTLRTLPPQRWQVRGSAPSGWPRASGRSVRPAPGGKAGAIPRALVIVLSMEWPESPTVVTPASRGRPRSAANLQTQPQDPPVGRLLIYILNLPSGWRLATCPTSRLCNRRKSKAPPRNWWRKSWRRTRIHPHRAISKPGPRRWRIATDCFANATVPVCGASIILKPITWPGPPARNDR